MQSNTQETQSTKHQSFISTLQVNECSNYVTETSKFKCLPIADKNPVIKPMSNGVSASTPVLCL